MSILVIDIGNTRIKWGLHAHGAWQEQSWTPTLQPQLEVQLAAFATPATIIVSNVAGNMGERAVASVRQQWDIPLQIVRARPSQCNVSNGYTEAERLGSDRWAALIAAHALHPDRDLLVVQAGTAVTIDTLTAQGHFRGGMIVPGLKLMLDALVHSTAGLTQQNGTVQRFPSNTADAMMSGAANAIVGAIERSFSQLAIQPLCLLSGGDVDILLPLLHIPTQKTEQLVLEGLLHIALESTT